MKIIDQYIKEIEKDLYVNEFNLKEVSLKTPSRKHFWVSKLIHHKKQVMNLKGERYELKKRIVEEIRSKSPVKVTIPIAEKTAWQHGDMVEIQQRIEEQELIVEFLEKTEKTFSALGFDIKNIIEIIKMETL